MKVVVTEKPSVARDLSRVLGVSQKRNGYFEGEGLRITWCIGHLLELEDPHHYESGWKSWRLDTLPMVPSAFALRVRKGAEDQWKVVERLLTDRSTDSVVNACDAGREGELIFRYAYQQAACRAPVERFWVSSLTDRAIRDGWRGLRPGHRFDALADAARCRSEADWLVGMNMTRAMTCQTRAQGGDSLWSIGRVQTPTLAMIVGRDAEIEAFVPETYWQVKAKLTAARGSWTATWFREQKDASSSKPSSKDAKPDRDEAPKSQRLPTEEAAKQVADAAAGRAGEVVQALRREKRERPPLLYDLTALQRRANQRYGMSAQRTLEVAQTLYERHKIITYPRTDARYLTSDQVAELPHVLRAVGGLGVYAPFVDHLLSAPLRTGKRLIRDEEVGDHHAIIPTDRRVDPSRLSADEKRIYDLVARRLMATLYPDAVFDLTDLVVAVEPSADASLPEGVTAPLRFRSKGRMCREEGWRAVDPPGKRRDTELPMVSEGDTAQVDETSVSEGQTKPPRPHDDASILKSMETAGRQLDQKDLARAMRNAGLGTPATRAAILQTLLDRKYVRRDKRTLRATDAGKALIDAVPVEDLKSPVITGRWEKGLADVAEGRRSRDGFMDDIVAYVTGAVGEIREASLPQAALVRTRPQADPIGTCPVCETPVRPQGPVYTCDTGRACRFVVFSTMSGRKISKRMVKTLLKDGRTDVVKGFKSKKGKPFEAGLVVQEDGRVGFWFPDRPREDRAPPREAQRGPAPSSVPSDGWVGRPCPACGEGRVLAGRKAFGCSRWREGCTWRRPFEEG